MGVSGCATPPSVQALLPVTGSSPAFQIHEYPITEQSKDNPTHAEFQQRVQAAVSTQQTGWHRQSAQDQVKDTNLALTPFNYHLAVNPTPPFSAFALYRGSQLMQRDIAQFWPISLKTGPGGADFLFTFRTLDGQKLVASQDGIHNWMDVDSGDGASNSRAVPVYFGDKLAYAETQAGAGNIYTGGQLQQVSIGQPTGDQLALQIDGRVVKGSKDINQAYDYSETFFWQLINGQPFYFYAKNGAYRLNYAGRDQSLSYDQIINGQNGDTAIFNPDSLDNIVWFYALRDGLWYYVEAGIFD